MLFFSDMSQDEKQAVMDAMQKQVTEVNQGKELNETL